LVAGWAGWVCGGVGARAWVTVVHRGATTADWGGLNAALHAND
jgi:hypothetical protein